ncbi:hypothetical protein V5O48_005787 [Marasmius crinis-equi]|uniref:Uncharacterized protein n=1 Tax=Marasmius crinis-equi TaxID=585013 RepID=A0ABR3FLC8_9AGAR
MQAWPPPHSGHPSYFYPATHSSYDIIPPKNHREMTREMLIDVLEHMSILLEAEFRGLPIRIVAHGGACMLLHRGLYDLAKRKAAYHSMMGESVPMRKTTRDVDYIRRSFIAEYVGKFKIADAEMKMQRCIRATALKFGLGADWMNADADVALPMSTTSSGMPYDPIYHASLQPFNVQLYTVFTSKNSKLTIINVTPAWAVALKIVRYAKWDPGDISLLLMNGTNLAKVHWTTKTIKLWLRKDCAAMNYEHWDAARLLDMERKIDHAVQMVASISTHLPPPTTSGTPVPPPPETNPTPTHTSQQSSLFIPADPMVSHHRSPRPLGPSVSLDSRSHSWQPSPKHDGVEDGNSMTSSSSSRKRRDGRESESHQSYGGAMPPSSSGWNLQALGAALPDTTNHRILRSRSAEFDHTVSIPFIPADVDRPGPKSRNTTKERPRFDKHADRKREKLRRDRNREFDRRSKWERRDVTRDDTFTSIGFDSRYPVDSDTDEDDSDTDEEDSDDSNEYTPMSKPPPEVYTREWQEERQKQEQRWMDEHGRHSTVAKENRTAQDSQFSAEHSRPQRNHPQHSQTWPLPLPLPARNADLMMSIYSPPQPPQPPQPPHSVAPLSLHPDDAPYNVQAPTHQPRHQRSFNSLVFSA